MSRLERDAKLGALEERADALQDGCAQFEKQAAAMKNKFWMENLKAMIAAGVVGTSPSRPTICRGRCPRT